MVTQGEFQMAHNGHSPVNMELDNVKEILSKLAQSNSIKTISTRKLFLLLSV